MKSPKSPSVSVGSQAGGKESVKILTAARQSGGRSAANR